MPENSSKPPRKTVLFSGHMIDAPGCEKPRFPAGKEPIAARAIANVLSEFDVGPEDLAICGGACGGDLLFAEAALARGISLEFYLPFDEPTFLRESVIFAGRDWRSRYFAAKKHAKLHVAPRELGPLQAEEDAYERNNRWMLDSAFRFGAQDVDLICLWNGEHGDGPGGTHHIMDTVRDKGGQMRWLNTTQLWS